MKLPWRRDSSQRREPTDEELHRYDADLGHLAGAELDGERRRLANWDITMTDHAAKLGRVRPEWEQQWLDEWQRNIAMLQAERAAERDEPEPEP